MSIQFTGRSGRVYTFEALPQNQTTTSMRTAQAVCIYTAISGHPGRTYLHHVLHMVETDNLLNEVQSPRDWDFAKDCTNICIYEESDKAKRQEIIADLEANPQLVGRILQL